MLSRAAGAIAGPDREAPLVLVVEDNWEMSRFIAESLAGEYWIATAFDGQEGVAKALDMRPDLIITGLMMPVLTGEELVAHVRAHSALNAVPIIVLSAQSDDDRRIRALREGAQDYLVKPFAAEELRARVSNLITTKRAKDFLQRELASESQDLAALVNEITLRKREIETSLVALAASEGRYRALAEAMPQMVWTALANGQLDYCNRRWFDYTGLTKEQTCARDGWMEALHAADVDDCRRRWREAVLTGQEYETQYRIRRASDGAYRWHLVRALPLEDAHDKTLTWFGAFTDIDDQKRSEEAQRFLANAGATLAASIDYEITLTNVARLALPMLADYCQIYLFDDDARLAPVAAAHVDPAKEAILADMQSHFLPNPNNPNNPLVQTLQAGQARLIPELTDAFLASIARNEEQLRIFHELRPRSGIIVPLVAGAKRLGTITFVSAESGRIYDQADLVLAEEIGRRAALAVENARLYRQAQEANRIKDDFLATVSHELRTPLNAILGWLHLLSTGRLDSDAAATAFKTIERNARSQAQLIEDLLDISRIVTGRLRLHVRRLRLGAVALAAVEAVRPAAEAKSIQVKLDVERGTDRVSGDPDRLQQVIWNLLSNSIKFTPAGGRVDIRIEHSPPTLHEDPARPQVVVIVRDSGEGIDPDFLPHVFERFRQADASTTRAHAGLGLGLAIVRHLVEMHGGTIQADSAGRGKGAVFTVRLPSLGTGTDAAEDLRSSAQFGPLARGEGRVQPIVADDEQTANRGRLGGVRVLVVDDEPDTREMLSALLTRRGCDVKMAASARQALDLLKQWRPDILLADIGMPGEDGFDLIIQIRALPAELGGNTPAVALTAYARSEDRERALSTGFQVHLAKPIEPDDLVAVLADLNVRS